MFRSVGRQPIGDIADVRMGVRPTAKGVGSSFVALTGAPFAPKVVISFNDAFFAVSLPDPDLDGGDSGGL
jgi:hypothetical protein